MINKILYAILLALLLPVSTFAEALPPDSIVKLIVGYPAGGAVDVAARLFAPVLSKELGATVIVENKAGVAGGLGGELVSRSAPTALILYFANSPTMTIMPHVVKSMPFDVTKDVVPIAPILSYTLVQAVNKDQPFNNVPELVAYAKANPGKVTFGSAGMGSIGHLSAELFAIRTGVKLTHVPYKGNAPAMTDVIGGQISMMFDVVGGARPFINSGRIKPFAVSSRERNAILPDVPTLREVGVENYDVGGWYALYGPAKMPADLKLHIYEATKSALRRDELKNKFIDMGYDLWIGTGQTVTDRANRELALWGTVTKNMTFD